MKYPTKFQYRNLYIVYLLSSDPGDLLVTITSGMWSSSSGILAVSSSKFKFRDSSSLSSWTCTCISADTCCWGCWSLAILWFSEWACWKMIGHDLRYCTSKKNLFFLLKISKKTYRCGNWTELKNTGALFQVCNSRRELKTNFILVVYVYSVSFWSEIINFGNCSLENLKNQWIKLKSVFFNSKLAFFLSIKKLTNTNF